MRPLDGLSDYLGALERRLRWLAFTRGAAVAAGAALALTVLAVLAINHYAFSSLSVVGARVLLFLGLASAVAAATSAASEPGPAGLQLLTVKLAAEATGAGSTATDTVAMPTTKLAAMRRSPTRI